jgi:hypothetical protein
MPVIPNTQEEDGDFEARSGHEVWNSIYKKKLKAKQNYNKPEKKAKCMAQVIEHLLIKTKVLSSNLVLPNDKRNFYVSP